MQGIEVRVATDETSTGRDHQCEGIRESGSPYQHSFVRISISVARQSISSGGKLPSDISSISSVMRASVADKRTNAER